MPKGPELPYLTLDEVSDRDHQEFRLRKQLSACWRGDNFDVERSFHIVRACAVDILGVVYPAYRKKPGFAAQWVPLIVNEAIHRTLVNSEEYLLNGVPDLRLSELAKTLEITLLDHLKSDPNLIAPSDFYAAFPKLWTPALPPKLAPPPPPGKQASAYAASGVDTASGSPLLKMAVAGVPASALAERAQTVDPGNRKALRDAYRAAFPDVKIADIIWAAKQTRREWTRWITGEAKDGLKPDRSFRHVLTSGKNPEQIMGRPRPTKYTT